MHQLLERRRVVLESRWPGHVRTRGRVGRGFLWEWGAEDLRQGERVAVKRRQVGGVQGRETVEYTVRLGQMRQVGQGSVAGVLAPQLALAHLRHLRHLRQGCLARVCWWARRVAPGRGDRGWYRGHEPGRPGPRHRTCA